ncbi:MAG: Smr/MutS family protein [Gemmatimonadota bacterium]
MQELLFLMPRRPPRSAPLPNPFEPLEGPIAEVVDLHGYRGDEARMRVVSVLTSFHRRNRGELVHIITGKGRRSIGAPVLRSRIKTVLQAELGAIIKAFGTDLDEGGWLVRLKMR